MPPPETTERSRNHRRNIIQLIGDFPKTRAAPLRTILTHTIAAKPIEGCVSLNALQQHFGSHQGVTFSGKDGFYTVTDLSPQSAGDVIRIKTVPQGKSLWYPTGIEDLWAVIKEFQHIAGTEAWSQGFEDVRAGRVPRPPHVMNYLDSVESKSLQSYTVVDFGSGDMRMPLIAAACGLNSIGVEIDSELHEMGTQNIKNAKQKKLQIGTISQVKGSFLDDAIIDRVMYRATPDSKMLCYLYTTPITEDLLLKLLPHLKKDDYIITYRETLSNKKMFPEISGRIDIKMETPSFMLNETPINVYRIHS